MPPNLENRDRLRESLDSMGDRPTSGEQKAKPGTAGKSVRSASRSLQN
ncbi:hypothetical protein J0895_07465 [Phormidium pseudopriestleyi FRX01]|uniref:Uncharacterized protein n=1 Tax=Phormidium pseudopriestleyi FRX01 TaxID=1759528 RepID=A0ABS3FQP9_9CYAN|nr:hypothetical protein [Phormidium pseudopriestleyi]MBO0348941.1 hypothetical protein [Phormidium pseudopriestleyi FRX01]